MTWTESHQLRAEIREWREAAKILDRSLTEARGLLSEIVTIDNEAAALGVDLHGRVVSFLLRHSLVA